MVAGMLELMAKTGVKAAKLRAWFSMRAVNGR